MADDEPLTPEQLPPGKRRAVFVITVLAGAVLVALSAGIIPADDRMFNAPRWVLGACGLLLFFAGFLVIVPPQMPRMKNFLGGMLLTTFAAIPGWIAFGPGQRAFGGSFSFGEIISASHPGETTGRIVFGIAAVVLGCFAAYAWWRWLRSLGRDDTDDGSQ